MKTLTHKRPTVSAEKTTGFEQLMARLALRHDLGTTLNNILFNIITFFIEDDVPEEDWALVASRYRYESMELEFLMSLVDLAKNCKNEHILIDGILSSDKFHFPEFTKILENVNKGQTINLYTIDMVMSKVTDVAIYHNQVEKGDSLVVKFIHATTAFLDRNNNPNALQEIAETYEWNQLDIKLLRVIALWACDHEECGYILLQKIIEAEKLHLCDLTKIAKTVRHSRIKWVLTHAIREASIVSGCEEEGLKFIKEVLLSHQNGAQYQNNFSNPDSGSKKSCPQILCRNCRYANECGRSL